MEDLIGSISVTNGYKWLQTNHKPAFRRRPKPLYNLLTNENLALPGRAVTQLGKQSKYGHCPNWLNPPPSILGSRGALLRVNRDILQNATKQRKLSYCWPLKLN